MFCPDVKAQCSIGKSLTNLGEKFSYLPCEISICIFLGTFSYVLLSTLDVSEDHSPWAKVTMMVTFRIPYETTGQHIKDYCDHMHTKTKKK